MNQVSITVKKSIIFTQLNHLGVQKMIVQQYRW